VNPPTPQPRPPALSSVTALHVAGPTDHVAEHRAGRPGPIHVMIADGQRLVRAGLRRLFDDEPDIAVAAEAANGEDLVPLVRTLQPDVVVIDAALPGVDGLEATRQILAESPAGAVGVMLLVDSETDESMLAALQAGAGAVLAKDSQAPEILHAVRVLAAGGSMLGPDLTRRLIALLLSYVPSRGQVPAGLSELTPREREVMGLVAAGLSNAEIAERLVVTQATAKTHVSRARRKLGARDRAQLVVYAYRTGLVTTAPAAPDDGESRAIDRPHVAWSRDARRDERRAA
jgi:DNA-binding NarL/FixJ family response regulator